MDQKLNRRALAAPLVLAITAGRGAGITFARSPQPPSSRPRPLRNADDVAETPAQTEGP